MSRILIVEDDQIVRMHLVSIIESMGHEVTAAVGSGEAAIDSVQSIAPDLALLDVHLEGMLDGISTATRLHEHCSCGILFATAFADSATIERSREAGAVGYLVKPFDEADVRASVSTALAERQRLLAATHQQGWLRSILGGLSEAILVTDPEFAIAYANPEVEGLGLAAPATLDGKSLFEILPQLQDSLEALSELLAKDSQRDVTPLMLPAIAMKPGSGSDILVGVSARRVDGDGDGATRSGLVLTLRNLSKEWDSSSAPTRDPDDHTRVLIYSHDTLGLGHLRRSLNISKALVDADSRCSVLIVTGSTVAHRFQLPERVDYVKLPAVRKVASDRYSPRALELSDDGVLAIRSNLLLRTTKDFQPDILIVDHAPRGMRGEILPSLDWLRIHRPGCRRFVGLRDIIDDASSVIESWQRDGVYDLLESSYDEIFIYGDQKVFDLPARYEFSQELLARSRFVNYVVEEIEPAPDAPPREMPLVVVSTGGGDGAVELVIGTYLTMLEQMATAAPFRSVLLPGPLVSSDLREQLRRRAEALDADFLEFVPSTSPYFQSADLVIGTAGYNTTTQILRYARRGLLIPRILHRREQLVRAECLQAMGLVDVLHPDLVSPDQLLKAIERALSYASEPLNLARDAGSIRFDGARRLAAVCLERREIADQTQEVGREP